MRFLLLGTLIATMLCGCNRPVGNNAQAGNSPARNTGGPAEPSESAVLLIEQTIHDLYLKEALVPGLDKLKDNTGGGARWDRWHRFLQDGDLVNDEISRGPLRKWALELDQWQARVGKDMTGSVRQEKLESYAGKAYFEIHDAIYAKEGIR